LLVIVALCLFACRSGPAQPATEGGRWIAAEHISELNLLGVDMVDQRNGFAVGDIGLMNGAVLRTSDGGQTWQPVSRTDEILAAVDFVSITRGWVAGYAGRIQRTDDGGLSWKVQRIEHKNEIINSIFFLDDERGWAVGSGGLLLSTNNGGGIWEVITTGRAEDLWSVRFITRNRGLIAGEEGLILMTENGGRDWIPQASHAPGALYGLAVASDYAIVVGENGWAGRTDDFTTWTAVESGTTESLNGVSLSGDECWGVGSKGTTVGSTDKGKTWKRASAAVSRDLISVSLSAPAIAVAVGRHGAVQFLRPE
jgi:photosystem II stability/assembly factor-like uncharacterized protein